MVADRYPISQLVADLRHISAEFKDEREILSRVRPRPDAQVGMKWCIRSLNPQTTHFRRLLRTMYLAPVTLITTK